MPGLVLSALFGLLPSELVTTDRADVVEINHYYDQNGRHVFDQIIFWEWRDDRKQHHVFAWRMWNENGQIPLRDWRRKSYVLIWFDGKNLRRVRAHVAHESWTQYDPEILDRQRVAPTQRRGLAKSHK